MQEVLERLDRLDQRIGRLDEKIEHLDQKMDAGFAQVDRRFEQIDRRLEQVDARLEQVDRRFEQVDRRFDEVDRHFAQVDGQLHKHGILLESLSDDVKLALEGISGNRAVMDAKFVEVLATLDERVQPIEAASRHFARTLSAPAQGKRARRKPRN